MRSLDECKAEIFRRSEEKMKQRRKTRNRVFAACIPLCLCLSIGAMGAISGGFAAKGENNMAAAPESAGLRDKHYVLLEDGDYNNSSVSNSGASNRFPLEPSDAETTETSTAVEKDDSITEEIGEDYEILKELLLNLEYSPHKVCRCRPQYKLKTDFGEFGIHLSEGYARCEEGQADLTAEQIQILREIIEKMQ